MSRIIFFLSATLFFSLTASYAEEPAAPAPAEDESAVPAVSDAERQAILKQFQGLANELNGMPQVPEMHHTIQIPVPDSENVSKKGDKS